VEPLKPCLELSSPSSTTQLWGLICSRKCPFGSPVWIHCRLSSIKGSSILAYTALCYPRQSWRHLAPQPNCGKFGTFCCQIRNLRPPLQSQEVVKPPRWLR
jgi:hypothetical protein